MYSKQETVARKARQEDLTQPVYVKCHVCCDEMTFDLFPALFTSLRTGSVSGNFRLLGSLVSFFSVFAA